jgi:hypothetical protein
MADKRTEPAVIDGVWHGPNACRACDKWLPPWMGAVPADVADLYCWGHHEAVVEALRVMVDEALERDPYDPNALEGQHCLALWDDAHLDGSSDA